MNTSDVLNLAADLIEERGWATGGYEDSIGLCLESAIALADSDTSGVGAWQVANLCDAGQAVREYLALGEFNHKPLRSLWVWNDRQAESAARVIEVLRAAAVIEAARENQTLPVEPRAGDIGDDQREYQFEPLTAPAEPITVPTPAPVAPEPEKVPASACIQWHGYIDRDGYGRLRHDGRPGAHAHRVAYESAHGPVPEGLVLDHLCRNRGCVNPDHLEPVTHRENTLRGTGPTAVNAAKTECIHGHPFDHANTYIRPNGQRDCRACIRARVAAYSARKRVSA